jgi:hypothetical protein
MRSRSDYEEYLVRLYFGDSDLLTACINRAYRDFNRTIHGLKQVTMKNVIHQEASAYLRKSFGEIQTGVVRIEASGITRTDPGYAHETGPSGVDEAWIIVCGYPGDIQIGYRCFPFHISL